MKLEELAPGEFVTGYLVDGNELTPYIVATLEVDKVWGPLLNFSHPLLHGLDEGEAAQFKELERWREEAETIPPVLVFQCAEGRATFFNCSFLRSKENFSFGVNLTLRPETVIYGNFEPDFGAPLVITSLKSCISGLGEWIGKSVFTTSRKTDEGGRSQSYTATVESPDAIGLSLADYDVSLSLRWRSSMPNGLELHMHASGWFETRNAAGTPVEKHLALHRQMRAILALNSGRSAWFSSHQASTDDPSTSFKLSHISTFEDGVKEAKRDNRKRLTGLTSMNNVDLDRFREWLENRDYWARATGPVLGILQRESYNIEDRVLAAGIAIEMVGKQLPAMDDEESTYGGRNGNQRTMATWTYRCILECGLDFSETGHSTVALAKAFAQVYNKTKHYEQDRQPELATMRDIGRFGLLVIRAVILRHLILESAESSGISDHSELFRINQVLTSYLIADDGWATFRPAEQEG